MHRLHGERPELEGSAPLLQILKSQIDALRQVFQEYLTPEPERVYEPEKHILKIIIADDLGAIEAKSPQGRLHFQQGFGWYFNGLF